MKNLFIISNESIFCENEKFYCDNLDLKSTPEGLSQYFKINLIGRRSSKKRTHEIKIKNINFYKSIFSFILNLIRLTKKKNTKFLVISISPYTFTACLFLKLFGVTPIMYLRSDGYGEYKVIFGYFGKLLYHLMFIIITKITILVSCRKYILRSNEGHIVSPSQLDSTWFKNTKNANLKNFRLLYVGRIKIEKGIFSLLKLLKNKDEILLSIVGAEKQSKDIHQKNVIVYENESNRDKLINYYDENNIFILPSFTEGHPMALLEALARKRPVIIFDDIKHVIGDKKGIFVSKRNYNNLLDTINFIIKNYENIQNEMERNLLPTNKDFNKKLSEIINLN